MPIELGTDEGIWKLRDEMMKPFKGRDQKWSDRRKVRYRRMDQELKSLPLNPTISDTALMVYQTENPNQEIHKRTKRLVANPPRFEVVVFDDDTEVKELGQGLEDGIKALYKWMNRGKAPFEWVSTQFQQGDGVGIGKVVYVPGHGASLANYDLDSLSSPDDDDEEANEARSKYRSALEEVKDESEPEKLAYSKVTDQALRAELPPYRLVAPDPLTCYWWEDEDGIALMVETGKKSLNPLLKSFASYGLTIDDNQRLRKRPGGEDVISAATVPDSYTDSRDLSTQVDYTEIRTRDEIVVLIEHPKIKEKTEEQEGATRGVTFRFPNPFGPYSTGYALIPADITTETDPADQYQPPALAAINAAQPLNVLSTARLSAALAEALAPPYIEVDEPPPVSPADEDKTPEVAGNREITSVQGKIKLVETPNVGIDTAEARILADIEASKLQEAIVGEASSDTSGHRLALQITQADLQMVPYQNARKAAIEELMKAIVYAIRKNGLPVYIPTLPSSQRTGTGIRVAEPAKITPEMADIQWELLVTLGSETAVTKFAKWQALALREEQGTLGYQTLVEQSDVEDPEDEIARVFEGKALKASMEQVIPMMVQLLTEYIQGKFQILQQAQQTQEALMGIDPETGLAAGGGARGAPGSNPEDVVRSPGLNMPINQSTDEFGPRVPDSAGVI